MIEFVVASHDDNILTANIKRSDIYGSVCFTIQRGFTNVPYAYNNAVTRKENLVVYCHHDVFLPTNFYRQLVYGIHNAPPDWGVLGVAGIKLTRNIKRIVGHIQDRGKDWGSPVDHPTEVDTLDELLLITRGDLRFDEKLEQDFYGADICLQARAQGRKVYVIPGYCHHNSGRAFGGRTDSFYKSQEYFKNKWKDYLPIATTCAHLT